MARPSHVFAVFAVLLAGQGASAQARGLLEGTWGADHVEAVFGPSGATIRQDCAEASVAGPVRVDGRGRFSAEGVFETYRPGPQPADGPPPGRKATFSGRLRGSTLILTMRLEGGEAAATWRLARGVRPRLVRCF